MSDDESTSFDPIAPVYDRETADEFAPTNVTPVVEYLAALAAGGRVLELGIGTGRIALPLAARGIEVVGIDASEAMLARMRSKPGGAQIPAMLGDIAEISLPGPFTLAYIVDNTLSNVITQEKQVACFERVAEVLAPGGAFVIEGFLPDLAKVAAGDGVVVFEHSQETMSFDVVDVAEQRLVSHHYRFGPRDVHFSTEHRYTWPAEMDLMARIAGLRLRDRCGGWEGEPFTSSSRTHISVYERPR